MSGIILADSCKVPLSVSGEILRSLTLRRTRNLIRMCRACAILLQSDTGSSCPIV